MSEPGAASISKATTEGSRNVRPGREATTGVNVRGARGQARGRRRAEELMVPEATFSSYYGKPILNPPVWSSPDIPGYLFLGGLAGAAAVVGAGAQATGRPGLARVSKIGAAGSIGLSLVALIHDLGRPMRFVNMLRVVKPTSPMSIGTWLLSAFAPAAFTAAASEVTGLLRPIGTAGTAGAAVLGPAVAAYTGVLFSNTAVPAWHDARRMLPYLFVASGASSAAGLGLLAAPRRESTPMRRLGAVAGLAEIALSQLTERGTGLSGEAYGKGRAGLLMKIAEGLTAGGALGSALLAKRSRTGAAVSGAALLAGSACLRFGVFEAGMASARDPRYTVEPQRQRVDNREAAGSRHTGASSMG
ncbi:MAG: polysulfide reductase NrfD [Candidatus Dormibacteraeota bacterium]|nr:polysulfide reductase NrfD [Candidatus Dormibacteraeota bacterium]